MVGKYEESNHYFCPFLSSLPLDFSVSTMLFGNWPFQHIFQHFQNHKEIDDIFIVCIKEWISYLNILLKKYHIDKVKSIVSGGETGQNSIYNGLCTMSDYVNKPYRLSGGGRVYRVRCPLYC